jgi:mannose-6-phosphate isomerase-like protein (cupin superfamily)
MDQEKTMADEVLKSVRRVVTGRDANDKAVVLFDAPSTKRKVRPGKNNLPDLIWTSESVPAEIGGAADMADVEIGRAPKAGGTVFRIIDYPPVTPEMEKQDVDAGRTDIANDAGLRGLPPSHPFMHRTRTLDYVVVLQGEIDMLLDDTTVHLKAGDVMVQQGTNHAWVNRGTEVCRIALVLVDAIAP